MNVNTLRAAVRPLVTFILVLAYVIFTAMEVMQTRLVPEHFILAFGVPLGFWYADRTNKTSKLQP